MKKIILLFLLMIPFTVKAACSSFILDNEINCFDDSIEESDYIYDGTTKTLTLSNYDGTTHDNSYLVINDEGPSKIFNIILVGNNKLSGIYSNDELNISGNGTLNFFEEEPVDEDIVFGLEDVGAYLTFKNTTTISGIKIITKDLNGSALLYASDTLDLNNVTIEYENTTNTNTLLTNFIYVKDKTLTINESHLKGININSGIYSKDKLFINNSEITISNKHTKGEETEYVGIYSNKEYEIKNSTLNISNSSYSFGEYIKDNVTKSTLENITLNINDSRYGLIACNTNIKDSTINITNIDEYGFLVNIEDTLNIYRSTITIKNTFNSFISVGKFTIPDHLVFIGDGELKEIDYLDDNKLLVFSNKEITSNIKTTYPYFELSQTTSDLIIREKTLDDLAKEISNEENPFTFDYIAFLALGSILMAIFTLLAINKRINIK